MTVLNYLKRFLNSDTVQDVKDQLFNIHLPARNRSDVIILSTPRSGSTWLAEIINTQPGFKYCGEPLNLRNPRVRDRLSIKEWGHLYKPSARHQISDYLNAISSGSMKFKNATPFSSDHYRFLTSRVVFKILHGAEHFVSHLHDKVCDQIIFLTRHPVPTTLSRNVYPRLPTLLNSAFRKHYDRDQIRKAKRICQTGTPFEKGILSWCLQNALILKNPERVTLVTYEQLVLSPDPIFERFESALDLPLRNRMEQRLDIPSGSTSKSNPETQEAIVNERQSRKWLVEKWKNDVSKQQKEQAKSILDLFRIELYDPFETVPNEEVWIE